MSAIESVNLQDRVGASVTSQTDQPARPSVLPTFSGKLSVDGELKLSNEYFNETLNDFSKDRNTNPLSQLISTPPFPTPHVLAQFASKTYTDYEKGETDAQYETRLDLPDGWKLLTTASNGDMKNGYFGAAYWHPDHQQVVIAHRGTKLTMLGALWTDVVGVVFKHHVPQMCSASTFAHKVVEVLREVKRKYQVSFQLFFTGHSLGGWLAQVTTFTTEYLTREENLFLLSYDRDCYHPHTVVFESPGCKDMLSQMRDTFDVRHDGRSIDIEHLDITSYLSAPNRINTCNRHTRTVYRIFPDLSYMDSVTSRRGTAYNFFPYLSDTVWLTGLMGIVFGFFLYLLDTVWQIKHFALYTLATHNMDKIVAAFDPETGQVHKNEQGQLEVQVVVDWPISTGLRGGEEYNTFFEWAEKFKNYHPDITDESFQYLHCWPIRYRTKLYDRRVNILSVFSQEEQEFIRSYSGLRQWPEFCKPKELFAVMKDNQAQEQAGKILQSFEIEKDKIRCTDASTLQALIPYVKRLLQLFPEIKEIKNRVLQCETRPCVQRISQSPLEFKSDASSFREFLESEQQKVLHLQVVDGDEWTGLIKVHQLLQKTNCLIEGRYTVLKLESLLTLNKLLDFSTLRLSSEATYTILVVCEATEQLREETQDMIRTLFENIKQKLPIKIILATRSKDTAAHFLQNIGKEIFGNEFVTREEQLNWSDLTSSSQKKLLDKSVKFQGATISLNELMSAESPVANFLPLDALLEEKELKIADPVPISNAYNESYYIGRTLCCKKVVKQEIYSDTDVKEKHVLLTSTEQEFIKLCQQYPNKSVHWLKEDKSGKLIWQQSQGSLETLRKYIDTDSSDTYTADDLGKLLEQAEHQRVMLISNTAGMGKSTVLTHLSKEIKQKFQSKWVVRINVNNHTDVLKALEQERIDKEKAIEFLSQDLLKLESGLETELFKQCCEQKQKVRIVIMLDGFDEISPFYKQIVIDLLQALRQTAVEQLWVTTRPHLKEDLEDKLQQLSYTLEPFSEENQVEFLTKFWILIDCFTKVDDKEKEEIKKKLEIYAEKLIKNLSNSISDQDAEFTSIPLQCHMLAEAFVKAVKLFYESAESMTELPSKLDFFELYGRFIERKYEIYQEKKCQVNVNNVVAIEERERDLKIMREDHQLLALKVLFTEEQVTFFQNNSQCTLSGEQLTRIGIVQVSHDGKPHFIHRTFAEYYVADCLVNRLTEEKNISQQVLDFILKDIFLEDGYRVVRAFIDRFLLGSNPSNEVLKQCGNRIHDLGNDCELILHRAVAECNDNIVAILLRSLQAAQHTDTLVPLLLAKDYKNKNAWVIAIERGNLEVMEKLWEWAKDKLTTDEIKNNLLLARDDLERTVLHMAAEQGRLEILQEVWEWANEKLATEEINNKLLLATDKGENTVFHMAAGLGRLKILQKLWEWANEKLTEEEINNKLLLGTNIMKRTILHVAAEWGELEILQKVWEWANDRPTREEINNKLLLATDNLGRTVFHMAANQGKQEILEKVWEWANDKLTTEEIKNKILLATHFKKGTVFYVAAEQGRLEILEKIWEWANEKLTKEVINNELLLGKNKWEQTVFHMAANRSRLEILQKVWEWANERLTAEEINNKMLIATDYKGRNVFYMAAGQGELEILQTVWEWANERLTAEEINNKMLIATDYKGRTVFHMAAEQGRLEILLKVLGGG